MYRKMDVYSKLDQIIPVKRTHAQQFWHLVYEIAKW
jgi:hypothetical protein